MKPNPHTGVMLPELHEIPRPILDRIFTEYSDMPGLQLTARQAQKLFGLDEVTCRRLLEALVQSKFLYRTAYGMYGRTLGALGTYKQL